MHWSPKFAHIAVTLGMFPIGPRSSSAANAPKAFLLNDHCRRTDGSGVAPSICACRRTMLNGSFVESAIAWSFVQSTLVEVEYRSSVRGAGTMETAAEAAVETSTRNPRVHAVRSITLSSLQPPRPGALTTSDHVRARARPYS